MDILTTESDLECMLLDKAAEPKVLRLSLLEKITNGFSHEQEIGRVGSAVVYKAMLQNGAVAVKTTDMCENEFLQEVECLLNLKHKNNVRFLGYCVETQGYMDNDKLVIVDRPQRILCFEHHPTGSLDYYIKDSSGWLEWRNIMHMDLKPSNISLYENMVPKITDFGLSRGYRTDEFTCLSCIGFFSILLEILIGNIGQQKSSEPQHMSVELTGSTSHHRTLQILNDITNNMFAENILGIGGFSVVYKGKLQSGKVVAVKKLLRSATMLRKQFENEVKLHMKLEHPNIVQPVGYCYETRYYHKLHKGKIVFAQNTESLFSLEYLPKGTLSNYISGASSGLDWHTRWKIINGVSYGLHYLHVESKPPIIHLDLKPSNILLDKNMIPKINDFGVSRLFDQKQTISSVVTSGTFGYMAPEYLVGIVTPMSDIFSLGVIIMEVITGHRDYPYDMTEFSKGRFIEQELQKWRNVLKNELGYRSQEICCKQIKGCIQIGLECVNPDRHKRPTMKKIIDILRGLV